MNLMTGIALFVLPFLIAVSILAIFGVVQWRKKAKRSQYARPLFRPIGPDYSGYTPAPTQPLPGGTSGFQPIKATNQGGTCFLTGEPESSCRCGDCMRKRRGNYIV